MSDATTDSSVREALNNALSDQKTIEQLSSSGMAAKLKRAENKARIIAREKAEAEAEAAARAKEQQKTRAGS